MQIASLGFAQKIPDSMMSQQDALKGLSAEIEVYTGIFSFQTA